ncbi:sugar transporter [Vallitalea longa]|uniref:Sugar transporter n=1 Tax=Vallitalea longa TaxID=2936439 RepID=A0A9W6DE24_9FIRM|nr:MFS transporter [Vallitalea longa]GKX29656.1 sugar transporter [Vallitalea longa]
MSTRTFNKASKGEIFGFSFNNASTNAVFIALSTYFLVYCTEIYNMSPVTVGLIMTGTRILDAVTDPVIGILIDKTDTKFGRFRPWILAGSLISALSFILLFCGFQTGSKFGDIVLIVILYSIFIVGYTMQTACTKSAQTIVTAQKGQRTILNAFGMMWTLVVYALILGTVLPIINAGGGNGVALGWRNAAIYIAIIQVVFAVFVIISLGKKDVRQNYIKTEQKIQPKLKNYVDVFAHNRALQMLIVAASTNKIAQTLQSGMTLVFYFYVVQNQDLQGIVPTISMVIMIVVMFFSIKIISKYGRVEVFKWSSIGGFVYGLAMIPLISLNPSSMIWLIVVLAINQILISGTTDQNLISMIGDAADYEYYLNGRFIPGMIGTAFSFIDKVISSLSSTLVGFILAGAGFVSITETPRSPRMFWTVLIAYCAIPALGHFCSIIGMKYHPLKKAYHEKMLEELSERGDYNSRKAV